MKGGWQALNPADFIKVTPPNRKNRCQGIPGRSTVFYHRPTYNSSAKCLTLPKLQTNGRAQAISGLAEGRRIEQGGPKSPVVLWVWEIVEPSIYSELMIITIFPRVLQDYLGAVFIGISLITALGGCRPPERQPEQSLPVVSLPEALPQNPPASEPQNGFSVGGTPPASNSEAPGQRSLTSKATTFLPLEEPVGARTPWQARTRDFADWPKIDLPTEIVVAIPPDGEPEESPSPTSERQTPTGGSGQWLEGLRKLLPF
jgi:hypothetical protein